VSPLQSVIFSDKSHLQSDLPFRTTWAQFPHCLHSTQLNSIRHSPKSGRLPKKVYRNQSLGFLEQGCDRFFGQGGRNAHSWPAASVSKRLTDLPFLSVTWELIQVTMTTALAMLWLRNIQLVTTRCEITIFKQKLIIQGEKPHVCDVCSKGFSTSSSLNTHRRIHSGEKPHQCPICGKRFTASSNLYYHRMTHNKVSTSTLVS